VSRRRRRPGALQVVAELVIGCDGRSSTVRKAAGLAVLSLGSPIDVLWFRLSKQAGATPRTCSGVSASTPCWDDQSQQLLAVRICVIAKGGIEQVHASGWTTFKAPRGRRRSLSLRTVWMS